MRIAMTAARTNLGRDNVISVRTRPALDSEGEAAISIIIELRPGSVESISGDDVTKTFAQIWDQMQRSGDDRFPIVQYATSDELQDLLEGTD